MRCQRDEGGGAIAAVLVVASMAAVSIAGFSLLVSHALAATEAQTVADGAALAFAAADPATAHRIVADRGELVEATVTPGRATVVVEVREARAIAEAFVPRPIVGTGDRAGLAPAMLAALSRADELLGRRVPVVSGYRSREDQERLWAQRANNPLPVAEPGTSRHELGLAVDVPRNVVGALRRVAAEAGLCHPLPESDPVHFVVCQSRQ